MNLVKSFQYGRRNKPNVCGVSLKKKNPLTLCVKRSNTGILFGASAVNHLMADV